MIVDSSILLAILFEEPNCAWAEERLMERTGTLCMSTVNLTEVLIRLRDRKPADFAELEDQLLHCGIEYVPPDLEQARIVAEARLRIPLNLGDCFAYALARVRNQGIMTLDADFRALDVPVLLP